MQIKDRTLAQYRPAYDAPSLKPYLHNKRAHRVVLDHAAYHTDMPQYWRDCADRDTLEPRTSAINWWEIYYVDFKIHRETEHNAQFSQLRLWLEVGGQPYKVLHMVNDDQESWLRAWLLEQLCSLRWQGKLYLDLVSRHTEGDWTEWQQQRQTVTDSIQFQNHLAGFDYRIVDQHTGVALHQQLIHPHGVRQFYVNYDV